MSVKEAIQKALQAMQDIFSLTPEQEVRLEEVERSEDDRYWLITFGYNISTMSKNPLFRVPIYEREYKVVKLDSETGEVISIKIRQLLEPVS